MSGAAIALVIVVACAAFYVIKRGKRTHPTGAFRNKPTRDAAGDDAGPEDDPT